MKNIFLIFAATVISVITISNVKAQNGINDSEGYYINPCSEDIFVAFHRIAPADNTKDHSTDIDARAIKNFHKEFPEVNNEVWYKTSDGGYIASFHDHSVETKVAYNQKGKLHHSISYYSEKNLPHDIRRMLKSSYYDYAVLNITEVQFDDQKVYMVLLQDENHLKVIRIAGDEMEEVQNYKRG